VPVPGRSSANRCTSISAAVGSGSDRRLSVTPPLDLDALFRRQAVVARPGQAEMEDSMAPSEATTAGGPSDAAPVVRGRGLVSSRPSKTEQGRDTGAASDGPPGGGSFRRRH